MMRVTQRLPTRLGGRVFQYESGRWGARIVRGVRTIPNESLGRQVKIAGPFNRSMASSGAPEFGVVRP
jgi:hypothetical protein